MKILFIYKHNRPFVENDLKILQKHYDVEPFFFKLNKLLDFLIGGVEKGGTSSLRYHLSQHPEIYMPIIDRWWK